MSGTDTPLDSVQEMIPHGSTLSKASLGLASPQPVASTSAPKEQLDNEQSVGSSQILQSILTEVRAQGEILTAFVASQHEFKKQVTNEILGIKNVLESSLARFVN